MKYLLIIVCVLLSFAGECRAQLSNPQAKYHSSMPPTTDPELLAFFANPDVEWYTEDELPKVYQHSISGHKWVSIYKKISPPSVKRNSNGNGEWPWAHPAVMSQDNNVKNVIGILQKGQMETFPVRFDRYYIGKSHYNGRTEISRRKEPGNTGTGWRYGVGTDVIELVTNKIGQHDYCFKVHRMTLTQNNEWFFRVYRPFRTQAEYEAATGTTVPPPKRMKLKDTSHDIPALEVSGVMQHTITEPISAALSQKLLLETPFELCASEDFIPKAEHENQLWPVGYLGAFLGNATIQDRCRNCHRDVSVNVQKYATGDWYGQFRGGGQDKHKVGLFSHRPKLRSWYGRGSLPTESGGDGVQQLTMRQQNPVRAVLRQQQVRQFAPVRIQSGSS